MRITVVAVVLVSLINSCSVSVSREDSDKKDDTPPSHIDPTSSRPPENPKNTQTLDLTPVDLTITRTPLVINFGETISASPQVRFSTKWASASGKKNASGIEKQIGIVPAPGTDIKSYRLNSQMNTYVNCGNKEKTTVKFYLDTDGTTESRLMEQSSSVSVDQSQNIYHLKIVIDNAGNCDSVDVNGVIIYNQR